MHWTKKSDAAEPPPTRHVTAAYPLLADTHLCLVPPHPCEQSTKTHQHSQHKRRATISMVQAVALGRALTSFLGYSALASRFCSAFVAPRLGERIALASVVSSCATAGCVVFAYNVR